MLIPQTSARICLLQALSPVGRCKSLDVSADGYGRGEAACLCLLTDGSSSTADKSACLVSSTFVQHNGRSSAITAPHGPSQTTTIRNALSDSALTPSSVKLVSLHGTGTPLGDPIEIGALHHALQQPHRRTMLTLATSKSMYGHTEGTAGITGILNAALSLEFCCATPNFHLRKLNPYIADGWAALPRDSWASSVPRVVAGFARAFHAVGTSSFGMSGINAHSILSKPEDIKTPIQAFYVDGEKILWIRHRHWPLPPSAVTVKISAFNTPHRIQYEILLEMQGNAWLKDHCVLKRHIVPAAAMIDVIEAARSGVMMRTPANAHRVHTVDTIIKSPMEPNIQDKYSAICDLDPFLGQNRIYGNSSNTRTAHLHGFTAIVQQSNTVFLKGRGGGLSFHRRKLRPILLEQSRARHYQGISWIARSKVGAELTFSVDPCRLDAAIHLAPTLKHAASYERSELNIPVGWKSALVTLKHDPTEICFSAVCPNYELIADEKGRPSSIDVHCGASLLSQLESRPLPNLHGDQQKRNAGMSMSYTIQWQIFATCNATWQAGNDAYKLCIEGEREFKIKHIFGALLAFQTAASRGCRHCSVQLPSNSHRTYRDSWVPPALEAAARVIRAEHAECKIKTLYGVGYKGGDGDAFGMLCDCCTASRPLLIKRPMLMDPSKRLTHLPGTKNGTVLVTGGLGALGRLVTQFINASEPALRICLLARTVASSAGPFEISLCKHAIVLMCDVSCEGDVEVAFEKMNKQNANICGIHHTAGALRDSALVRQTPNDLRACLSGKPIGGLNISSAGTKILNAIKSNLFYGSIASTLGSSGQASYAISNRCLESLACGQCKQGRPVLYVSWGAWGSVGMAVNKVQYLRAVGVHPMTPEQGIQLISLLLQSPNFEVDAIGANLSWKHLLERIEQRMPFFGEFQDQESSYLSLPSNDAIGTNESNADVEVLIRNIVEKVANQKLTSSDPLLSSGIDSVAAMEIQALIQKESGISLPATLLFDYPTLGDIKQFMESKMKKFHSQKWIAEPPQHSEYQSWITSQVIEVIGEVLGFQPSEDASLLSAGVDSLTGQGLVKALAEKFGFDFPATAIFDYPTIKEITAYIQMKYMESASDAAIHSHSHLNNSITKQNLPVSKKAPKLTKTGYYTVPSINQLQCLSDEDLNAVSHFVVGRQDVGEIAFLLPIDLTNIDLDKIVQIEKGKIVVYPPGTSKPAPGFGLNQPALLRFNKIRNTKLSSIEFQHTLQQAATRMGAIMVHYDPKSCVWVLKIDSF